MADDLHHLNTMLKSSHLSEAAHRPPYDAHLCAQDPTLWADGFYYPTLIYQAIRDSTGVPFLVTAAKVGLPPTPWVEGFMLGVYGHVALER